MRYIFTFITIFCLSFLVSCKKEAEKKYCWQIVDNIGNDLARVCDKTEAELLACAKDGSCGTYNGGTGLTECNYYKSEGEKFCWIINNRYYNNMTENEIQYLIKCFIHGATASRANCDNCQNWYSREKRTYKPSGMFTYTPVIFNTYCGDSANAINNGGQTVKKNDADSLIVVQYSIDGVNWH